MLQMIEIEGKKEGIWSDKRIWKVLRNVGFQKFLVFKVSLTS